MCVYVDVDAHAHARTSLILLTADGFSKLAVIAATHVHAREFATLKVDSHVHAHAHAHTHAQVTSVCTCTCACTDSSSSTQGQRHVPGLLRHGYVEPQGPAAAERGRQDYAKIAVSK